MLLILLEAIKPVIVKNQAQFSFLFTQKLLKTCNQNNLYQLISNRPNWETDKALVRDEMKTDIFWWMGREARECVHLLPRVVCPTQQELKFKSRKTLPGPGNNDSTVVLARDELEPDVLGGFGLWIRTPCGCPPPAPGTLYQSKQAGDRLLNGHFILL